jgi:cytochrome c556
MLRPVVTAILVAGVATVAAQTPRPHAPQPPAPQVVGTMSELMVQMIYPTSDAIFYISTRTPKTDQEWLELQAKTLTLAESANLLMMPSRARGRDQWLKDAKLMLDAGAAAFKAAKAKDVAALEALSDQLLESCTTCHQHFRANYGKRGL